MRPLTLSMTYFGPYPQATIDFTRFSSAPLYLIAGKTGAGKTTIFDALCFALFGKTTNDGRDARSLRADFAPADQATRVALTFEHEGVTYQVERQPAQELMGRGKKLVSRGAKATITYPVGTPAPQAISKVTAVDHFVEDLLHLRVDQFRQIVLLPQGKFREFLAANSKAKEELLRSLFATDRYKAWGDELTREQKAAGERLKARAAQLTTLRKQVAELDPAIPLEEWLSAARTRVRAGQAAQEQISREITGAEAAASAATAADEGARALASDQAELVSHETIATSLAARAPEVSQLAREVETIRWAQAYQTDYHDWERASRDQKQLTASLAANQQAVASQAVAVSATAAGVASLTAQQDVINQAQAAGRTLAGKLPLFERVAKLSQAADQAEVGVQSAETAIATVTASLGENRTHLATLTSEAAMVDLTQEAIEVTNQAVNVAKWKEAFDRLADRAGAVDQLKARAKKLEQDHQQARDVVALARGTYQKQDQAYLRAEIVRLYDRLKPGSPCPVCGSTDHPRHHRPVVTGPVVTAAMVKKARQALDQAQVRVNRLESDLAATEDQLTAARQEVIRKQNELIESMKVAPASDLATLRTQLGVVEGQYREAKHRLAQNREAAAQREGAIRDCRAAIEKGQVKLTRCQSRQQEATLTLTANKSELTAIRTQLPAGVADLAAAKAKIAAIDQEVAAHQAELRAARQAEQAARELAATLAERTTTLQNQRAGAEATASRLKDQLTAALAKRGASWDFWQPTLAKVPTLAKKQGVLDDYRQAVRVNQANLARLRRRIADRPAPDLAATKARRDSTATALAALQTRAGREQEGLSHLTRTATQVAEIYHQQQAQLHDYDALSQLALTINGKGAKKLGLERYVQRAYFQKVLDQANPRLAQLTNGRYQFILDDHLSVRGTRSGLEINVYDDHVGKERSVHTLSGGEGFMASLALALALGEVVQQEQGGVHIDALFVDEGFGSLDPDALDDALVALQSIRGSRMVGIISHVTELEERIPNQIRVHSVDGRSRISYQTDFSAK